MSTSGYQELLKCPFCGGEAKVSKWEGGFKILCQKVFCAVLGPFNSEAEAIAAWNTRTFKAVYEDGNLCRIVTDTDTYIPERTCHIRQHGSLADWPEMVCWSCSECCFGWHHSTNDGQFSYCPNCGAKVVEE